MDSPWEPGEFLVLEVNSTPAVPHIKQPKAGMTLFAGG